MPLTIYSQAESTIADAQVAKPMAHGKDCAMPHNDLMVFQRLLRMDLKRM